VAYGILCGECQQRGIAKAIYAFEKDTLTEETWMLLHAGGQSCSISGVKQIDGVTEGWVFDPLVVGQCGIVRARWFFNMCFEPWPAGKAVFACDRELSATETQGGAEDCGVGGSVEAGKKFPDSLGHGLVMGSVSPDQISCLKFEMVEIRIGGEAF